VNTLTSPPTVDDARLVEQARAGAQAAFTELVRRHQQTIRGYLIRLIGELHAADDVAQEVFLAAYHNLQQLQVAGDFLRWIRGIARYQAISFLRERISRRRLEEESLPHLLDEARLALAEGAGADEQRDDWLLRLRFCLDRLAPYSRKLIDDHYFAGMTTGELAKREGRRGSTMRMTLLRIRQTLHYCLTRARGEVEN
jgi:RNA polymerase sigma-70 factor (ECF subfamily)